MMHHYKDDNDSDSDSQNGYGGPSSYDNNDEHDEQSTSEQTGFLSGGDPTNHNEFR
eukprot:CAMPEP_0178593794 /NCGR_PEP_ID=MMETSP0697-20121206/30139_1 /TAXON_ID=265572 /ORGANISM="Extubocellulus spinifer, Strain CCMP396" /LENGTH=55 /DNA_ID=CAMNT_0020230999 /DNA_START=114 /DNA_END=278 /DNA_ORIENTATION=-